ncbi:MAG: TraM recognition domain-containing protein, partial [Chloroflexi bacterium]|nr:TraM recognition domain-containing protein [Chloroflexota bacterium]
LAAMARVHQPEHQRRDFYLYVDEFQNFATDSFVKVLSEARKYRLNVTLANQYVAQMPEAVQKAIFGNCGTLASFVVGAEDAGVLANEFGQMYSPEKLTGLTRYQMLKRLAIDNMIHQAFPAQAIPLACPTRRRKAKVVRSSKERFARPR